MSRRRTLRMVVVLLAVIAGAQLVRAGLVRAKTCCTPHCRRATEGPSRCCTVQVPSADPTLLPAPVHPEPAGAATALLAPPPAARLTPCSTASAAGVGCRGAPRFLLACNLRL